MSRFIPEGGISLVINSTIRLLLVAIMTFFMYSAIKDAKPGDIFRGKATISATNNERNSITISPSNPREITVDQTFSFIFMCLCLNTLALVTIFIPQKIGNLFKGNIELPS
jgi:hypothetical protein